MHIDHSTILSLFLICPWLPSWYPEQWLCIHCHLESPPAQLPGNQRGSSIVLCFNQAIWLLVELLYHWLTLGVRKVNSFLKNQQRDPWGDCGKHPEFFFAHIAQQGFAASSIDQLVSPGVACVCLGESRPPSLSTKCHPLYNNKNTCLLNYQDEVEQLTILYI